MSDRKRDRPPRYPKRRKLAPGKKPQVKLLCPITGKKQYDSEEAALIEAARAILAGKATFMRAYVCNHCSTWHNTSTPVIMERIGRMWPKLT